MQTFAEAVKITHLLVSVNGRLKEGLISRAASDEAEEKLLSSVSFRERWRLTDGQSSIIRPGKPGLLA